MAQTGQTDAAFSNGLLIYCWYSLAILVSVKVLSPALIDLNLVVVSRYQACSMPSPKRREGSYSFSDPGANSVDPVLNCFLHPAPSGFEAIDACRFRFLLGAVAWLAICP